MRNRRNRQRQPCALTGTAGKPLSLCISSMGSAGDGVAHHNGVRYFVPSSLPGEIVTAKPTKRSSDGLHCDLISIETASPQRVKPTCRVFDRCGGCTFQHWDAEPIMVWKTSRVEEAMRHRGFDSFDLEDVIAPITVCPPDTRRRATLAFKGKKLGFRPASGHGVTAIEMCPMLCDGLNRLIKPLRAVLVPITSDASVRMTWTDLGADVVIVSDDDLGWEQREALAEFAAEFDVARLSWDNGFGAVPVCVARQPVMKFADYAVAFPEGGFLQPSADGEAALWNKIRIGVLEGQKVADLFCGLGTFSLPLTQISQDVLAVDSDGQAISALSQSVAKHQGIQSRLRVNARDLFSEPMTAKELDVFDVVVFDPPRAGANAQSHELAQSKVSTVVAVSCNPASFARDARTLVNGGYELEKIWPVDQFPMSAHVEVVALFRKQ